MTETSTAQEQAPGTVYAQMIMLICGDCGHEEIRDAQGVNAMHDHLYRVHRTVWADA